jgi:hypothetical protein
MPAIGAGLGGLLWIEVRGLIEETMTTLNETSIATILAYDACQCGHCYFYIEPTNQSAGVLLPIL